MESVIRIGFFVIQCHVLQLHILWYPRTGGSFGLLKWASRNKNNKLHNRFMSSI